ncbi:MAG: dephospho-CoA kinase [Clostridia bacterium]|nr:dephospho-CoA kinase [Clostridia bacterium]
MIVIGLCGSSGSGKGYVCDIFKKYGVEYIDTDKVYQKIAVGGSPCVRELCNFFGDEIINSDGSLNRKMLSKRVFEGDNAAQHLKMLNRITHKYIREDVVRILSEFERSGVKAAIIDAPVLFESGFDSLCHVTVCVTAPRDLKLQRILERDKITRHKAEARIDSQLPDIRLRELCDYEIVNDGESNLDGEIIKVIRGIGIEEQ